MCEKAKSKAAPQTPHLEDVSETKDDAVPRVDVGGGDALIHDHVEHCVHVRQIRVTCDVEVPRFEVFGHWRRILPKQVRLAGSLSGSDAFYDTHRIWYLKQGLPIKPPRKRNDCTHLVVLVALVLGRRMPLPPHHRLRDHVPNRFQLVFQFGEMQLRRSAAQSAEV